MRFSSALLVGLTMLLASAPAQAASIALIDWFESIHVDASASDPDLGSSIDVVEFPSSLPSSGTPTATHGAAQAISDYDFSSTGFNIEFAHSIPGVSASRGASGFNVYFEVDADIEYTISGSYSVVSSDGRFVQLSVTLFDIDIEGSLFESEQISVSTPNESFTLGMLGGDSSNSSIGSLTGTLYAGQAYGLLLETQIRSPASSTTPATASGFLAFNIGQPPEAPSMGPTAIALLCSALVFAAVHGLRAAQLRG